MKIISIYLSATALLILSGWIGYQQYQQSQYQRIPITKGSLQIVITAPGKIVAEKKANLAFKTTGRLSYLPFKKNDQVKKNQIVASLDQSDLQAVKAKKLKDYLDARWNWEQQRENFNLQDNYLIDPNLSDSQKRIYEKKQFALDRSVFDVEIANRAIKNASLYAPFNGTITQINNEINEWVSPFSTEPVIQLVDFSTLYFNAEIDQEDSDKIKIGQTATIKLDAQKNITYQGSVYQIDRTTTTTTAGDIVIPIKINLNTNLEKLKLGWEGDAQILLEEKSNILLLPKKAVEKIDGKTFVSIWQKKQVIKREVKLGAFDGTNWEILKGLNESDELAISSR